MERSKVIILSGVPLSGKSSFARKLRDTYYYDNFQIFSRDSIRINLSNGKFYPKFNKDLEKDVNEVINVYTEFAIRNSENVIIDETNCKTGKILSWINKFKKTHEVWIVIFNEPMHKLLYRNIKRYLFGGERKWIPIKVIRQMKDNFNKIDWDQIMKENVIFSTPENMLG